MLFSKMCLGFVCSDATQLKLNKNTLESGIIPGHGINIAPRKFVKNEKKTYALE